MGNIVEILRSKPGFVSLKPAATQQVEEAEKKLQLRFSGDYRNYVLNLGAVSFYAHELTGVCASSRLNVADVTMKERGYTPSVPADWYVVEQLHIDGIVVWQSADGAIYQTVPNAVPQRISGSLAEYIATLIK